MVIGGFALPMYGAVRTTVDLGIAVKVDSAKEFGSFVQKAAARGLQPRVASFANSVSVFLDEETGLEVEFWLRPDGIRWNKETLRRRNRAVMGGVRVWLVSPEDLIVSKLARPDRGVSDEKDVAGILARSSDRLDFRYLRWRARQAGVEAVLGAIRRAIPNEQEQPAHRVISGDRRSLQLH